MFHFNDLVGHQFFAMVRLDFDTVLRSVLLGFFKNEVVEVPSVFKIVCSKCSSLIGPLINISFEMSQYVQHLFSKLYKAI